MMNTWDAMSILEMGAVHPRPASISNPVWERDAVLDVLVTKLWGNRQFLCEEARMLWSIRQNAGEVVPRASDTPWYTKCHGVLPGPCELDELVNRPRTEAFITVAQLFDVLGLAEVRDNVAGFPYFKVHPSSVHCDRLMPLVAHFVAQCSMGRPSRADAESFQLRSVPWTVPRAMGPFRSRFEEAPIEFEGYFREYYTHFYRSALREIRQVARFRSVAPRPGVASGSSSTAPPPSSEDPSPEWLWDAFQTPRTTDPRASPRATSTAALLTTTVGPPGLWDDERMEATSDQSMVGERHSETDSFPGILSSGSPGSPRSSLFDSPPSSE